MGEITLSLKDTGLLIIGVGLIILIFYCITLVKNLVTSVKITNRILEDSRTVTQIASERATEINGAVGDMAKTVGAVAEAIKGNQSVIKALTNLVNAVTSLKNLIKTSE